MERAVTRWCNAAGNARSGAVNRMAGLTGPRRVLMMSGMKNNSSYRSGESFAQGEC
jgi:hypothetical protein